METVFCAEGLLAQVESSKAVLKAKCSLVGRLHPAERRGPSWRLVRWKGTHDRGHQPSQFVVKWEESSSSTGVCLCPKVFVWASRRPHRKYAEVKTVLYESALLTFESSESADLRHIYIYWLYISPLCKDGVRLWLWKDFSYYLCDKTGLRFCRLKKKKLWRSGRESDR